MALAVFRPGERLMQRLRMPGKFAVVSVSLLVPLLVLLWLYIDSTNQQIDFAAQERVGVSYLQVGLPSIDKFQSHRGQALLGLLGRQDEAAKAAAARAFEADLSRIEGMAKADGDAMQVTQALADVKARWADVLQTQFHSADEITAHYEPLAKALLALIASISDRSNLALDPDIDSYYAMVLSTDKLPGLITRLAPLRGYVAYAAAHPEQSAAVAGKLAAFSALTQNYLYDARVALDKVRAANPEIAKVIDGAALDRVDAYLNESSKMNDAAASYTRASEAGAGVNAMLAQTLTGLDSLLEARIDRLSAHRLTMLGIVVAFFLCAMYAFIAFYSSAAGGFKAITTRVTRLGHGDLTASQPAKGTDELADAINSLRTSVTTLAGIVHGVRTSAEEIAVATDEISTGNSDLASRGARMAATVEETAASMDTLNQTVQRNVDSSQQANQLAMSAFEVAMRGGQVVNKAVESMQAITASSRKIGDIIQVIDGIAFQTNILALNAAVEAARAGEQGRGFAVVASEVRSLAQRSAGAAKEISALIRSSIQSVDEGAGYVGEAGTTMSDILASIQRVADIMNEISAASTSQSEEIKQIAVAVREVDSATQQNAALVEQISAAATSLRERATQLSESVKTFQVGGHTL